MKIVLATAMAALIGMVLSCNLKAQTKTESEPRVELGTVQWGRDLDAAKKQSAETGKPIFVLFQEVPG